MAGFRYLEPLCAIAFFRALFGCFVLNFSSHFLLLTPPGKKTTTGDTSTSSLKNYVQNKSYQCFQICTTYFDFDERKFTTCAVFSSNLCFGPFRRNHNLYHIQKKLVNLPQLVLCSLIVMCQVNKPNYIKISKL